MTISNRSEPSNEPVSSDSVHQNGEGRSSTRTKRALLTCIIGVTVTIIVILAIYFVFFEEGGQENVCKPRCCTGGFCVDISSNITATIDVPHSLYSQNPTDMMIILSSPSQSGTYFFPSGDDGVVLELIDGVSTGTVTYRDLADNGRINPGDQLLLSDMEEGAKYNMSFVWSPGGDLICCEPIDLSG